MIVLSSRVIIRRACLIDNSKFHVSCSQIGLAEFCVQFDLIYICARRVGHFASNVALYTNMDILCIFAQYGSIWNTCTYILNIFRIYIRTCTLRIYRIHLIYIFSILKFKYIRTQRCSVKVISIFTLNEFLRSRSRESRVFRPYGLFFFLLRGKWDESVERIKSPGTSRHRELNYSVSEGADALLIASASKIDFVNAIVSLISLARIVIEWVSWNRCHENSVVSCHRKIRSPQRRIPSSKRFSSNCISLLHE